MRRQVNKGLSVASFFESPDDYKGEFVVLGGTIAGSRNTNEGTYIDAVEGEIIGKRIQPLGELNIHNCI